MYKVKYTIEVKVNDTIGTVTSFSREECRKKANILADNYKREHHIYPYNNQRPFRDEYNADLRDYE